MVSRSARDVFGRQLLSTKNDTNTTDQIYLVGECVFMTFSSINLTVTDTVTKKNYWSDLTLNVKNDSGLLPFNDETCLEGNDTVGNVR